jgi:hypothetical protein
VSMTLRPPRHLLRTSGLIEGGRVVWGSLSLVTRQVQSLRTPEQGRFARDQACRGAGALLSDWRRSGSGRPGAGLHDEDSVGADVVPWGEFLRSTCILCRLRVPNPLKLRASPTGCCQTQIGAPRTSVIGRRWRGGLLRRRVMGSRIPSVVEGQSAVGVAFGGDLWRHGRCSNPVGELKRRRAVQGKSSRPHS